MAEIAEPQNWPDYATATDVDLQRAVEIAGPLFRYGNFLNAILAGMYAEREDAQKGQGNG